MGQSELKKQLSRSEGGLEGSSWSKKTVEKGHCEKGDDTKKDVRSKRKKGLKQAKLCKKGPKECLQIKNEHAQHSVKKMGRGKKSAKPI